MTSDLDIYRAAQGTIEHYGDDAAIHAAQRADEVLAAAAGENKADRSWIKRRI